MFHTFRLHAIKYASSVVFLGIPETSALRIALRLHAFAVDDQRAHFRMSFVLPIGWVRCRQQCAMLAQRARNGWAKPEPNLP